MNCIHCGKEFGFSRTFVSGGFTYVTCPHCKATFRLNDDDGEVELNDEQVARNTEVFNAAHEMCKVMTENEDLEWDAHVLGSLVQLAIELLLEKGEQVHLPCVVTNKDGSQYIQEYYRRD